MEVVQEMGYAQPVIYEAGGARQLIIWHPGALVSLDPVTGDAYWEQPWDVRSGLTVATPVRTENYLLVSQFYHGSLMMRLDTDRPDATMLWKGSGRSELPDETDGLHVLITTSIILGDYIYGVDSYGELRGLDARTGERVWMSDAMTTQNRWGAAFMVRHDDRFFVNNEEGGSHHRPVHPRGVRRARPDDADRANIGGRPSGHWAPDPVEPDRQLVAPRLRQPPRHSSKRPGDHSRLPGGS